MRRLLAGVVLVLAAATQASAEVRLTIVDNRVTLLASNATLAQILAEWARVGGTRIVNGERVAGSVTTLELSNVSETDALEIILRSVSAYLLVPRATPQSGASRFDRILILPTTAPPPRPVTVAATPPPAIPRPQFAPPNRPEDDDPPPQNPSDTVPVPGRPPVFTTFPPAQPAQQVAPVPAGPTSAPSMPVGVSTPGMVVPVPVQPGQPAQPGQQLQPGQIQPGQTPQQQRP